MPGLDVKLDQERKFERVLYILNLLDQRAIVNKTQLAKEWNLSKRTVERYINSLRDAGFDISFDKEKQSYEFPEKYSFAKSYLSTEESLILAMAKKLLSPQGGGFEQAFEKLEKRIHNTAPLRRGFSGLLPTSVVVLPDQQVTSSKDLGQMITELGRACIEHQIVSLSYNGLTTHENTERQVEPYYLYLSPDGFWYLRAYCWLREDWRIFALDRVENWRVLDRCFHPKPKLKGGEAIQEDISRGFGTYMDGEEVEVILRFSPDIRSLLERRKWHPTQTTKDLPDGWLEMTFQTTGMEAVKSWLYQWIPYVIIVQPTELCKEVIGEIDEERELLTEFKKKSRRR